MGTFLENKVHTLKIKVHRIFLERFNQFLVLTSKIRILRSLPRLFIILVSLMITLFIEKCLLLSLPIDTYMMSCPTCTINLRPSLMQPTEIEMQNICLKSSNKIVKSHQIKRRKMNLFSEV